MHHSVIVVTEWKKKLFLYPHDLPKIIL